MDNSKLFRQTWEIARASGLCDEEFELWYEFFKASTIWPVGSRDGEMIGALLLHGMPDGAVMMHTVIKPEWEGRWMNKTILRAFRGWKPGVPVVTLVKAGDEKRQRAIKHFGFTAMDREMASGYEWFVRGVD